MRSARIIYEVNLTIRPDVVPEFLEWLGHHRDEIAALPGFLPETRLWRREDDESPLEGWQKFTVHYFLESRQALDTYLKDHAPRMRSDGVQRFGDAFKAHRRILSAV